MPLVLGQAVGEKVFIGGDLEAVVEVEKVFISTDKSRCALISVKREGEEAEHELIDDKRDYELAKDFHIYLSTGQPGPSGSARVVYDGPRGYSVMRERIASH